MRLLVTPLLALICAFSLPAQAQHDHHAAANATSTSKAAPLTDGVVKKVDKAAGEVVIQHGQLDSIGMPPMTMSFGIADKAWLNKLKAGDKIRFAAELKDGNAIVSRYEAVR